MNGIPTALPQPAQRPQKQQPQGMPPQNDPRMNAAMNVVESNIPEYLNPTDALMKRKQAGELAQQAMALMASADRQTAMSQQPPTPPTIAEQVDQRAMEGISGIAQRLAPGMQQRGKQVQQAQARKMIGGGMPSMGAPNMARMADGGIVGYQEGGLMGPPEANMLQRMGQGLKNYGANAQESMGILKEAKAGMGLPYEERSAVMKQVRDEIEAQNQNRDPNFIERMGQKLMGVGLDVEESKAILKKFYDNMGKTYEQKASGMAMGGGVKRFQEGMKVEADLPQEVLDEIERLRRISELNAQMETTPRQRSALSRGVNELTPEQAARNEALRTQAAAVRTPTGEVAREEIFTPISDASVGTAEGGRGAPQTDVARTLESITGLQVPTADISSLPRADALRDPLEATALKNIARDPEAERLAEESRKQTQAAAAYGIPQALLDAYTARQKSVDEANAAMNDPKKQSRDEIRAMLSGFATPGGIARSGIAAGQGVAGVQEAAIQRKKDQGEEAFGITKELADLERTGNIEAFKAATTAGQSAFERASAGVNQASQSLAQLATSDETRAQAASVQDYTRQMNALKSQLNVFLQQEKLAEQDKKTAATLVAGIRRAQSAKDDTILEIQNSMIVYTPEQKTAAQELIRQAQAEKALLQEDINSLAFKLGLPVNIPAASGAGGDVIDFTEL